MEKLIRFINEYGKTGNCWPFQTYRIEPATDYTSSYLVLSWDDDRVWDWKDWFLEVPRLISKEYGFIWWLVENDKIDFDIANSDISKDIVLWREPDFYDFMIYRRFLDEEKLLMLLSISDTPIDDLVSYLK